MGDSGPWTLGASVSSIWKPKVVPGPSQGNFPSHLWALCLLTPLRVARAADPLTLGLTGPIPGCQAPPSPRCAGPRRGCASWGRVLVIHPQPSTFSPTTTPRPAQSSSDSELTEPAAGAGKSGTFQRMTLGGWPTCPQGTLCPKDNLSPLAPGWVLGGSSEVTPLTPFIPQKGKLTPREGK